MSVAWRGVCWPSSDLPRSNIHPSPHSLSDAWHTFSGQVRNPSRVQGILVKYPMHRDLVRISCRDHDQTDQPDGPGYSTAYTKMCCGLKKFTYCKINYYVFPKTYFRIFRQSRKNSLSDLTVSAGLNIKPLYSIKSLPPRYPQFLARGLL